MRLNPILNFSFLGKLKSPQILSQQQCRFSLSAKAAHINVVDDLPISQPPASFTVPVLSMKTGESVGTVELRKDLFGVPVRKDILHRVVVWKLACGRAGTHTAKTRGEMSGRKGKLGNQKGGGRARIGSSRTPVRKGGGTAFPPKQRDFSYTLQKKVRRLGLKCALSSKFAQNKLIVVDNFDLDTFKTGPFHKMITARGWTNAVFVDKAEASTNMELASRNIPNILCYPQKKANVHDMLRKDLLILHQDVLEYFHLRTEGLLPRLPGKTAKRRRLQRLKDKLRRNMRAASLEKNRKAKEEEIDPEHDEERM